MKVSEIYLNYKQLQDEVLSHLASDPYSPSGDMGSFDHDCVRDYWIGKTLS